MSYTIQIRSYLHSRDGAVVTVLVPKVVQTKYDHMVRLGLYLVLAPDDKDRVEIMTASDGIQLGQRFCEFEDAAIIAALSEAINFADPPALLKLKNANLEASKGSVRVQ